LEIGQGNVHFALRAQALMGTYRWMHREMRISPRIQQLRVPGHVPLAAKFTPVAGQNLCPTDCSLGRRVAHCPDGVANKSIYELGCGIHFNCNSLYTADYLYMILLCSICMVSDSPKLLA